MIMEPKDPVSPDPNQPPVNPDAPAPAQAPVVPDAPAPADPAPASAPKDPTAKLQSQKDKLANQVSRLEQFLEPIAVEREVDQFLATNKSKFPDLVREDLLDAPDLSAAGLTAFATRLQTRLQEHAQAALHKIENPSAPVITIEDRNTQLQELKKDKGPGKFQKYMRLKQMPFSK